MYHLAVSELPMEGFSCKFFSWTLRSFRIHKIENIDVAVWLFWCYTVWKLMFIFYIRCFFKTFITLQSNSRNTVHFKTMAYCVCAECGTVWSGFGGVSVQQMASWWVCVCVGIVWWLWVEGIKCEAGLREWVCIRWLCGGWLSESFDLH